MFGRTLIVVCALSCLGFAQAAPGPRATRTSREREFDSIKTDPVRLRAFLQAMPKGGDLHNHVTGAVYAESYIRWAAELGLCVDATAAALVECTDKITGPATEAFADPVLYRTLIDALSVRNLSVSPSRKSGHDQFFGTFAKFEAVANRRRGESLAEIANRAANQHISYLELSSTWDLGVPLAAAAKVESDLANRRGGKKPTLDLDELYGQLMDAGLRSASKTAHLDQAERRMREVLGCGTAAAGAGCRVTIRYLAEGLRAFTPVQVFSMLLWAFEQNAADSRFAGINMVQPEDWYVPIRDYDLHMRMVDFLHSKRPSVNVALHAGELTIGLVPPDVLGTHIAKAITRGHARRIGHGTDIVYAPSPAGLMREMRAKKIAVEISLSSSDTILGITGPEHPLRQYLRAGVPVIICTDDEGVSRSDLTNEYMRAVLEHGVSYAQLKQISSNGLVYSFLDDATKSRLLTEWEAAWAVFESSDLARTPGKPPSHSIAPRPQ
jgi:adenosine deaminase